ncbi:mechanosensitive ion channel family protein [Candidatus Woesearchaeota archaeon]|nr:mechanosensitive ion channel family protein [Candidatus Woesearchaeota archaeon]
MLHERYLALIQQNKYIYSLTLLVVFYILSQLVVVVSRKIILRLTRKTKTEIDDLIVRRTNKPISMILLLVGVKLALLPLGINEGILNIAGDIISSLIILVITYIFIAVFGILIDNWDKRIAESTKSTVDDQLIPMFHRFSRISISIIGLLFILPVWGIQIGPLLTSLGIAGIAIAFALQSTLGNIFGGISIILDKSVRVGDKIQLDKETMGTVVDIGLRSTKIKTWDGELVTIPNGKLADSRILNFIQPEPPVRIVLEFGVEYGSDTTKVRKVVLDAISKLPGLIKEPAPKVLMTEMADFALKFKALFWVENFDIKFDTKALATEEIYNNLRKAGIVIPFPTRTVYLKEGK